MMKRIVIVAVIIIQVVLIKAQTQADSLLDMILFSNETELILPVKEKKLQFLYIGAGYDDKVLYMGRESGIEGLSGFSSQLFYFHSSGFGIGIAGSGYDEISPNYYSTVLFLGYSGKINKMFRYRASYSRYFYTDDEYESSMNNAVNAGLSFKNNKIGSSLNFSFPFGKDEISPKISWNINADFTLIKFGKYDKLEFEPQLSLEYGDETVYSVEYGRFPSQINEYEEDKFGWMNTSIEFPLSLSLGNFDLQAGYTYNIPRSLGSESIDNTGSFSLSIGYIIGL